MSVVEFPARARQAHQGGGLCEALISGGLEAKTAQAIAQSVMARLAAHQGPDVGFKYTIGMPADELVRAVDAHLARFTAPLLLELVRAEAELFRANEALAAARPARRQP